MNEHPILFSAPMIRAILDGRKTQTRRIVSGSPNRVYWNPVVLAGKAGWTDDHGAPCRIPYGKAGDTLWVRETFSGPHCMETAIGSAAAPPSKWARSSRIWYWADGNPPSGDWTRPRPSIHMPRWASRITLRITDVRVERLQAITEDDAAAEGCSTTVETDGSVTCGRRKSQFRDLWDSLNAKRGVGWDTNPWVWVVEFERGEAR